MNPCPGVAAGGSSLLDRAAAALNDSDADAHVAPLRGAGGGAISSQHNVGTLVHVHGAGEDDDGEVGTGAMPVTSMPDVRARGGCHLQRRARLQRALECHLLEGCTFT